MHSVLSREALFLLNNLFFILILLICLLGVIYPLISELLTGQKVTFGPPWYEQNTGPLFAVLLVLMGIAPLSAWGHSTKKTLGRAIWRPLAGAMVVLAAVIAMGVRHWAALIAFFLCAFVLIIIVYEFYRAVRTRVNYSHENPIAALAFLIGRNRRRYGGFIIHIGVVLMALGIVGIEMFQTETQATILPGESIDLQGYTLTLNKLDLFDTADGRNVARASMSVSKNGKDLGELFPRRDYYYDAQQGMTIPGLRSTIEDDLYVILVDWQPISSTGVTFKIYHNPLVNWLWVGAFVFIIGTFVAAWPDKDKERHAHQPLKQSAYNEISS